MEFIYIEKNYKFLLNITFKKYLSTYLKKKYFLGFSYIITEVTISLKGLSIKIFLLSKRVT